MPSSESSDRPAIRVFAALRRFSFWACPSHLCQLSLKKTHRHLGRPFDIFIGHHLQIGSLPFLGRPPSNPEAHGGRPHHCLLKFKSIWSSNVQIPQGEIVVLSHSCHKYSQWNESKRITSIKERRANRFFFRSSASWFKEHNLSVSSRRPGWVGLLLRGGGGESSLLTAAGGSEAVPFLRFSF